MNDNNKNGIDVKCLKCGFSWQEDFIIPMHSTAFLKKLSAILCPKCAAPKKNLLIMTNKPDNQEDKGLDK